MRFIEPPPKALIYYRKDLSPCWQWHETQCKSLARRFGYTVDRTIWFTARDDARMYRLLHETLGHNCEAIFVPDLEHLDLEATFLLTNGLQIIALCGHSSGAPETYTHRTPGSYEALRAHRRRHIPGRPIE
ncbi:hypothetical protein [Nocardia miyunensis]|uniref:hypothetical protein n=1 Tax=Nocardia miyunensis TaxID=282684 RepID=UPI00083717E7|nr:hypothetical protein [Nocardia miyunensis]